MAVIRSLTLRDYAPVAIAKWYEVENLTLRTVASYRAIVDKYLLPVVGDVPIYLFDNDKEELLVLLQDLMRVKRYKTRRNRVCLLRRLLVTAVQDGFLQETPSKVSRLSVPNEMPATTKKVTITQTKKVTNTPRATLDEFVFPNPKMPQTIIHTKGEVDATP